MEIVNELSPEETFKRINCIIDFMRESTTVIDPEKALDVMGLKDIDHFNEEQLTYCLIQAGIRNPDLKHLFKALQKMSTEDLVIINSNQEVFDYFCYLAGGLYYAKAIRRLIKKQDILLIKELLMEDGYEFVFSFSNQKACLEDYPLLGNFKGHLYVMGHRIFYIYLSRNDPIINEYVNNKILFDNIDINTESLRISNEYALKLAITVRDFIINRSGS